MDATRVPSGHACLTILPEHSSKICLTAKAAAILFDVESGLDFLATQVSTVLRNPGVIRSVKSAKVLPGLACRLCPQTISIMEVQQQAAWQTRTF